ncbi:MAG: LemA family protein [Candidatus Izemoplasmatales bacterium]|jgi:LemA protein|nr:LemA family protein [Candidatus Izemoplasmatales bacterium]MDD4354917.1 LemA family protein [Candidatus Izemoplasmatales bacterium]MDD4987740.1 LemA family protein [Candidatus Izemoplasmatales bacterium]MDY0372624.1 LemA family protein [Candidatus Izemoplasmatales bacterium]NLF48546.1 LemA family protein [Acholeplasmataceae bacterium]
MKKIWIIVVSVTVLFLLSLTTAVISGYNSLVDLDESTSYSYTLIDARLEERHNWITSAVSTISGLIAEEQAIFDLITSARTAAASGDMEAMIAADEELAEVVRDIIIIIEDNPELISADAYNGLLIDIGALESALFVARKDYNDSVRKYNADVRKFPKVILASLFGFDREKDYWEKSPGVEILPAIDFGEDE